MKFNILGGGSVAFIVSYLFDTTGPNMELSLVQVNPSGTNTSWIERSAVNPSILYGVNQIEAGAVQSFTIYKNGTLSSPISSTSTGGISPNYVFSSSSGIVASTNYPSGNAAVVRTKNDGSGFGEPTFITFPPIGLSGASHPHQALEFKEELFIPDLGSDTVWRLVPDQHGIFSIGGQIAQPPGSGPRHAVIHNEFLVTLHELSSTITTQCIPPLGHNTSTIISNLSIVPKDQANLNGTKFAAAEILIPPPNKAFPSTLVYTSNRNTGTNVDPRGDAIAVFSLSADGQLKLLNHFFTGLQQVRGMQFGGPDNKYLVASGVVGNGGVMVFERVKQGTDFVRVAHNNEIPNLTSFVWL